MPKIWVSWPQGPSGDFFIRLVKGLVSLRKGTVSETQQTGDGTSSTFITLPTEELARSLVKEINNLAESRRVEGLMALMCT